jgi:hypothetical protein
MANVEIAAAMYAAPRDVGRRNMAGSGVWRRTPQTAATVSRR